MDDNIQKTKTPVFVSFSYFIRMLGPALGYTVASFSLKYYISPELTPVITQKDTRWMGAWWLGYLILACGVAIFSIILGFFPRELPRAALRRQISEDHSKKTQPELKIDEQIKKDNIIKTCKRILTNKTLMLNNIAGVFYLFGLIPYWIFTPKYIETQFRQSASASK